MSLSLPLFLLLTPLAPVGGSAPDQAPPAPVVAIERVHVVPMTSDTVLRDRTVVVRNGRIAAICRSAERCVPAGARRIDGGRRYLMPALADMHNHFGGYPFDGTDASRIRMLNQALRQYLMFGVMTARDPAGGPRILEARDAIARGELMGPRIFAASSVMDGDPPLFSGTRTFATPAAAVAYVRETAANGYDLLKVYSTLSLPVFDTVMATAREVGLTVAAHVPIDVPLEHALERGLRSIEHLTGYDVACAAPAVKMRPVATDIYQGWAWCTPEKIRALAELTARYRVWNVPTLALWDNTVIEVDRPRRAAGEPGQWEHPTMKSAIDWLYNLYGPRERAGITGTRSARLALVKALSDAGAPLLVGTDVSGAGYTVHQEMALFVGAGLTPYQALVAATREPARYLNLDGDFGVVAPGARADLVLLDANPLGDIRHSRAIRALMIRGRWWTRATIDAELAAIRREYAEDAATLRRLGPSGGQ